MITLVTQRILLSLALPEGTVIQRIAKQPAQGEWDHEALTHTPTSMC